MEISTKQHQANIKNAPLGGVKTEEGKKKVRLNALKHGLLTNEIRLQGEDGVDLAELSNSIKEALLPSNELENMLVERIIANIWRLKRLLKVEREFMEYLQFSQNIMVVPDCISGDTKSKITPRVITHNDMEKLLRYEASIERGIYKALHELQRLKYKGDGELMPPAALDLNISQSD